MTAKNKSQVVEIPFYCNVFEMMELMKKIVVSST